MVFAAAACGTVGWVAPEEVGGHGKGCTNLHVHTGTLTCIARHEWTIPIYRKSFVRPMIHNYPTELVTGRAVKVGFVEKALTSFVVEVE